MRKIDSVHGTMVRTAMEDYRKKLKADAEFAFLNYCANELMASKEDHWNFRMSDESWLMEDVGLDELEALVIFREMYLTEQTSFLGFTLVKTESEEATLYTLSRF